MSYTKLIKSKEIEYRYEDNLLLKCKKMNFDMSELTQDSGWSDWFLLV